MKEKFTVTLEDMVTPTMVVIEILQARGIINKHEFVNVFYSVAKDCEKKGKLRQAEMFHYLRGACSVSPSTPSRKKWIPTTILGDKDNK